MISNKILPHDKQVNYKDLFRKVFPLMANHTKFCVLFVITILYSNSLYSQNSSTSFEDYKKAQNYAFNNAKNTQNKHFKQYLADRKEWNRMLLGVVVNEEDETNTVPTYIDTLSTLSKELGDLKVKYSALEAKLDSVLQKEKVVQNSGGADKEVVIAKETGNKAVIQGLSPAVKERLYNVDHKQEVEKLQNIIPSICPIVGNYRISSPFGWRIHPIFHKRKFHYGIDLACPSGTPIKASAEGKVTYAGYNGSYGNYIVVEHANGYKSAYAHLSHIRVHVGDRVTKQEIIGYVGSTGRSTGPHLHYEVIRNDKKVDPKKFFS